MKLLAKVLHGSTQTVTTKKGTQLEKTRLKVQDVGEEVNGDLVAYWIDLLGENAPLRSRTHPGTPPGSRDRSAPGLGQRRPRRAASSST